MLLDMNGIPLTQMSKYKRTEFEDDEASSNGSISAEIPSLGHTNIRYKRGAELWHGRSSLEKILFITLAILSFVIIVLTIVIGSQNKSPGDTTYTGGKYCLTKQCITVASAVLNAMDYKVDPCEDFYEFACGGWIKANPIPQGKSIWGIFDKLWQENQLIMKNVLEQKLSSNASKAEMKAQIYYNSCMDVNGTMEKLGAKPLQDTIAKLGGWNVSGSFSLEKWNFQTLLESLAKNFYIGSLFSWAVSEDDKNSSRYVLQLDQSGLTLPNRDYYLNKTENDTVLTACLKYMTVVGTLLGANENETLDQMKEVIEFEKRLAQITIPAAERRDDSKLYHNMTISSLNQLLPSIDWVQYFNSSFALVKREIKPTDLIIVYAPEYLMNLSEILTEYLSTNNGKVILNNYLIWHAVRSLTPALSKAFRNAAKILHKALVGSDGSEELWRYCVSDTNNVIGFPLGAMFVREVFQGESKIVAEKMIDEVRNAFKANLPLLKWMDDETRKLAREKADAVTDMIGFPDYILNPDQLDAKYEGLDFKVDEYFENNIKVNLFLLKKNLERLDQAVNKTRWGMTPPTVNAYYTPTKNQIVFPAGILQAPFYDTNYPKSLNFGGMGVVMGHELTHAFDDQGREYDKFGNLKQWWKNSTIERFQEQTECIVEQYGNFTINGEHINGKQTLGENIADNGGLKAAYHAYQDWVRVHGAELPLPGVNLTHQQLFFLGFAQVWCSSRSKESTHLQILNDPHSPSKFRVVGAISNSHDFAREYKCSANSAMNVRKKCEIW